MAHDGTRQDPASLAQQSAACEHDVQLQLLDAVERAVRDGLPPADVLALVDQLIEYTNVHFHSEELMMRLNAFPHYEAHCAEHGAMMDEVRGLREKFTSGDDSGVLTGVAALRVAITGHIDGNDRAFIAHLADQTDASLPRQD